MDNDNGKEQSDKKILHLDEAERLPSAPAFAEPATAGEGRSHGLPAVPASSQAAEVVKQIIEQILANERRRARMEFVRLSVFFLVFLFVMLGAGIWFARQLLAQLREERQLTEQTWRMMAGGGERGPAVYAVDKTAVFPDEAGVKTPPALNREEVAKLEQNIKTVSELLKTKPQNASSSIQDMLQNQQNAIQALNARLNEVQVNMVGAPSVLEENKKIDFISAPVAEDTKLRMPIPSL